MTGLRDRTTAELRRAFLDPHAPLATLLRQARDAEVYALFPALAPTDRPGWVTTGAGPAVSLVANDYLGMSSEPSVVEAAAAAIRSLGTSRCASPVAGGYTEVHRALEESLAGFLGQRAVTLFASGYQANLGAIGALMQPGDLVVCDLLDHASIVDGARLAGAEVSFFGHNDAEHLAAVLAAAGADRRVLVVVEGVYSADGDIAPLGEICRVAHAHGALVMVDEAHSFGVLGDRGAGAADLHGVESEVDLVVGTMSKAIGMVGGFAAGDAEIIDIIRHSGRSLVFSAALPPAMVAGALRSVELIRTEPARRERLWDNARRLLDGLRAVGLDTLTSCTPVVPVLVADPVRTLTMAKSLAVAGVLVCPAIPPMVAPHRSRIRMHVTARHDEPALDHAVRTIDRIAREIGIPRTEAGP
ncbi:MAG: aminotransferase class I/II-fold pyridoxal phosphate-dependent enzyme [Actinophytocola sp.]|uniref:aminotransferase class I/II-fold pyridoxal phosphate-dependent enzyme n=1 Tax=Actinophytocola sp. TaxID=1872138 RepID=UPI00132C26F4|nr:aminotransferase class I/II-fold pyridoxal phosphate-dependent enzyme [Actinophytocola sp.]MPZ85086.1 aminotransferase class I/II-fold pyridoxal phosphate-dependent enzyme [Actinophytocola sp.]